MSEALSVLVAAALRTLPIDTVWVQYRRANDGAARLFDALGFTEVDVWRPRGARTRSCVRIVQRPWRKQFIQSQKGFPVSNVIGFIENVGRNAALRHASREQLLQAMRDEDLSPTQRETLLGADVSAIDSLIGIRDTMYCALFPRGGRRRRRRRRRRRHLRSAPPKKAPAKKPAKKALAKKTREEGPVQTRQALIPADVIQPT